ncbi:hypothetical protein P7C70_g6513, partial [Phenoliferia sp. Uapishka_3]
MSTRTGTRRAKPSSAYLALISNEQRREDGTFESKFLGADADSYAALRPTPAPLKGARAKANNLSAPKKIKKAITTPKGSAGKVYVNAHSQRG